MDMIGNIHPSSSKGHNFILVATDYFTKWVEAVPLKKVEHKDVIQFIKEQIIHMFGIPHSVTTDQGTMFTREEINFFCCGLWNTTYQINSFLCPSQWTSSSIQQSVDRDP